MKKSVLIPLLLLFALNSWGQKDSTVSRRWRLYSAGVGYMDGLVNYLEGYNNQILISNSKSGLPIYSDWDDYDPITIMPTFRQFQLNASITDTSRMVRLGFAGSFLQTVDSLYSVSSYAINDTIFLRAAGEHSQMVSLAFSLIKPTRKLFHFLRLYAGIQVEAAVAPGTNINFLEASYDYGDQEIIDYNYFEVRGKPRLNATMSAMIGLETIFFHRLGFSLEAKSGMGLHLIARERATGLSKTTWMAGLNYYFWDHPDPKPKIPGGTGKSRPILNEIIT